MTSMKHARRATTLLELLVALALGTALLTAVFAFLADLLSTRERIRMGATRQASIAALFDRLDADLAMSIAADAGGGPGVKGDAAVLAILTRGVLADPTSGAAALRDLQRTEYRFDRAARRLSARRSGASGAPVGEWLEFDGAFKDVRIRYHDGEAWLDGFDSATAGGLPMAVEISIWFESPTGEEPVGDARADAAIDDAARNEGDDASSAAADSLDGMPPSRPPDRRRVIAVPDARPIKPAAVAKEPA